MTIQFKTASEWGQWAREEGLKGSRGRNIARRLAAMATGRGKILQSWQDAIEKGRVKNWRKDWSTNTFLRRLAKTGRGISRGTLYNYWRDYQADGIAGLVDERSKRNTAEAPRTSVQPATEASPADPDRRQSLTLNLPGDVAVTLYVSAGMAIQVKEGESGIVIAIAKRRGGGASKAD